MANSRERIASKLVRMRQIDERAEILKTRDAREKLASAEERAHATRERQVELSSDMEQRAACGMSGDALLGYATLMEAATRSLERVEVERRAAEEIERRASSRLLSAVRERQAAEKLAERIRDDARREDGRREQRDLDEIATQRFGR